MSNAPDGSGGRRHHGHGGKHDVAPTALNYFTLFLQGIGAPVTQQNLNALYGVATLEGWNDRYNPLNVVQPEPGSTDYNSVGVQSYANFDSGVQGAIDLFTQNSVWDGVIRALRQGNSAENVLAAFKQVYAGWDPGVQFPMGSPADGHTMIGGNPGTGLINNNVNGGGGGGVDRGTGYYLHNDPLHHFLMMVPELRQIVEKAAKQDWSLPQFINHVENSNWYQSHSDTAMQVLIYQNRHPGTFEQRFSDARETVRTEANQLGVSLTPQQIHAIAMNGLLTGNISFSDAANADHVWLNQQLFNANQYSYTPGGGGQDNLQGGMAHTVAQIQQLATQYGFKNWSPAQEAKMAQDILTGKTTLDTYQQQLKDWASSAFPAYQKQIQGGQTVAQLAAPYVSSMSNILEVNPQSLDAFTPKIRAAMQGSSDGKGNFSNTPLWQFERQLRQDPRWQYTDNAHQAMSDVMTQVAQDWGFAA